MTDEIECYQTELARVQKRIEKLQEKHDFFNLSNYELNNVNCKLRVLHEIEDFLWKQIG